MTERIRWADETVNGHLVTAGYVGTFAEAAFRLYGPEGAQERWLLATRLIAGTGFIPADTPDDLKAEAERWLEQFVSSLGAHFPEPGTDEIVRWQDVRDGDTVLLDDELVTAEKVNVVQKPWGDGSTFTAADIYHRLDNGVLVSSERHGDRYTAVRRPARERAARTEREP